MAPPKAPPPGKPPVKGKAGKGLGKKVGPFSLWVYLVAIGGGIAVWWFFLRGSGGDGGYGGPEVVSGGSATPQDMANAGAPSQNGAPADQLSPEVLSQLDALQSQIGDVRGHVTELEDAAAAGGFTLNEDKTWSAPYPSLGEQAVGGSFGAGAGLGAGDAIYTSPVAKALGAGPRGPRVIDKGRPTKQKPKRQPTRKPKHPAQGVAPKPAARGKSKAVGGKVRGRHPAAAAHPAAHVGARRNVHPVAKQVKAQPKQKAKRRR